MLAYHVDKQLRKKVITQMVANRMAAELVHAYGYWKNGKGAAVGCLIKGADHSKYESKFSIPKCWR